MTIQLPNFLSIIQVTIWLPDKKSGNWMFPVTEGQLTECLLYIQYLDESYISNVLYLDAHCIFLPYVQCNKNWNGESRREINKNRAGMLAGIFATWNDEIKKLNC